MKPSERIEQLATKWHRMGIDPAFNGNVPDVTDYLNAIIEYLNEQESVQRDSPGRTACPQHRQIRLWPVLAPKEKP